MGPLLVLAALFASSLAQQTSLCPAVLKILCEESNLVSDCWSPGVSDVDCPGNGLCCFDGCANRCVISTTTPAPVDSTEVAATKPFVEQEQVETGRVCSAVTFGDDECASVPAVKACNHSDAEVWSRRCELRNVSVTVMESVETCRKVSTHECEGGKECPPDVLDVEETMCFDRPAYCYPVQSCAPVVDDCRPVEICEDVEVPSDSSCTVSYVEECSVVKVCEPPEGVLFHIVKCLPKLTKECSKKPTWSCPTKLVRKCKTALPENCPRNKCEMAQKCVEATRDCKTVRKYKTASTEPPRRDCFACQWKTAQRCSVAKEKVSKVVPKVFCEEVSSKRSSVNGCHVRDSGRKICTPKCGGW